MSTVVYKRPSGTTITVTDTPDTRAYAQSNGWEVHKPVKPRRKKAAKPVEKSSDEEG
jgi:hypothetical protein